MKSWTELPKKEYTELLERAKKENMSDKQLRKEIEKLVAPSK